MKPLISIIIPVFNHANVVMKSLVTIFCQTYRPLEIIMVNDGSTDDFVSLENTIKEQCSAYSIPVQIVHQDNKGAAATRNKGFPLSKGEYIIFWDADTIARPQMLEVMLQTLIQHPEASYVYSQFKFGWKTMKSQEFDVEDLKKNNYIDTTSLIRREYFCGFDETLKRFQDWDLWLMLLKNNKQGVFIPHVLYRKTVERGRSAMSTWLPHFVYHLLPQHPQVRAYEEAKAIIKRKHGLV